MRSSSGLFMYNYTLQMAGSFRGIHHYRLYPSVPAILSGSGRNWIKSRTRTLRAVLVCVCAMTTAALAGSRDVKPPFGHCGACAHAARFMSGYETRHLVAGHFQWDVLTAGVVPGVAWVSCPFISFRLGIKHGVYGTSVGVLSRACYLVAVDFSVVLSARVVDLPGVDWVSDPSNSFRLGTKHDAYGTSVSVPPRACYSAAGLSRW